MRRRVLFLCVRRDDNIHRAACAGDLAAVRGHLRRKLAAARGHLRRDRRRSLRRSLDQRFGDAWGRSAALHEAARSDHTAIVAFLLAKGASVGVQDSDRSTPLHYAAHYGRVEIAKLLLAAKASVDIKDSRGKTPLEWARERGHTEIVNLMMGKASWLHRWGPKHCSSPMAK
eukprot:s2934_g15.t1